MFRDWKRIQWSSDCMAAPGTKWQGWVRMKSADNPYALLPPQSKYCLWVEADGEIWRCSILRGSSIKYEGEAASRDVAMRMVQSEFERTVRRAAK